MAVLQAQRAGLEVDLAETATAPNVSLHPNLAMLYRRKIQELE
jgi:hypothetical protein